MTLTKRQFFRRQAMLHAYLNFHARKTDPVLREILVWRLLLEWASLGGRPDEVIT